MPINPYTDLYGTEAYGTPAGVGAGAGVAAGAGGASAAGFPWAIVIPAALSLLTSSGLFGETSTQRQRRMMEELLQMIKPQQQYLASRFKEFDPYVGKALQTQMSRTKGWGWPAEAGGGA